MLVLELPVQDRDCNNDVGMFDATMEDNRGMVALRFMTREVVISSNIHQMGGGMMTWTPYSCKKGSSTSDVCPMYVRR